MEPKLLPYGRPRRPPRRRRRLRKLAILAVLAAGIFIVGVDPAVIGLGRSGPQLPPLEQRIVSIAESQAGYRTDPSNTYCNRYSAYWVSGMADCGNNNLDEEWCADFAAWVWRQAGVTFTYQFINGDVNSSSASFYEWGAAHGTWHPIGDGYVPQPGDVAVYGLDAAALTAVHVAVVTSVTTGDAGPNVVNGDGDRTGFSVVETGTDQVYADTHSRDARISGYVSPTTEPSST
jgi:hypothetical protein